MNDLAGHRTAFDGITPYAGTPPKGFYPDWTGALTDVRFRAYSGANPDEHGGTYVETRLPRLADDGEGWFEGVSQVAAAREARGRFVMVTLGACYGAQAVGSYLTLTALNPMPCTLVAVEPDPTNLAWTAAHFRNNGIDPDEHWLVGAAIGATNEPTLFPIGAAGSGAQNAVSTNQQSSREFYAKALCSSGRRAKQALRGLLVHNTTGVQKNLVSERESDISRDHVASAVLGLRNIKRRIHSLAKPACSNRSGLTRDQSYFDAEIKLVSTVTLADILGPFERVDYLEVDIQQSEIVVFPPFMQFVKRKVRRAHIGTHGANVHQVLADLFRRDGWEIVFDYSPNAQYESTEGHFALNDGVLTVVNPWL